MANLTETQFLKDVESHVIEVMRNDGVYRHIRFRKPGTMCMHFDLITWPGYLCYTGDMGTYVFSRLTDMFEFFRTDREYAQRAGRRLPVNLSYWSEKLQAVDGGRRNGAAKEFSAEKMQRVIRDTRLRWIRDAHADCSLDKDQRRELWEAVEDDVLSQIEDSEDCAYAAARDFAWRAMPGGRPWEFQDFWEYDFTDYTHRFRWCCFALSWGIEVYDLASAAPSSQGEGEAA
ncbi:hypothetical protein BBB39_15450 [Bordetella trematum]|uniref:Uncharacterized protein n=1 Tax=Bordetella trematum TaxID=123899 RepID=A0A157S767_9BORD|nr:hypothetical protein [Bordetella trematum]AZR95002.1 hypothetical protein BBB39_15450 [Bordetella trematum]NNH18528.1 hypothetical protein [Bordetella trematum]SAI37005.1 Uncharacterised protein [Bordetella trematum]SAI66254.1 Uncharacterised protein [Bordetella trematum]SUV96690.1 Uncharacterised protein [Bordetella trematum]